MKNISVRSLIPIAAASALVAVGCGGKATDGIVGDGDGNGSGDGDGDQSRPEPTDPLSDASFPGTLRTAVSDYCSLIATCGDFENQNECTSLVVEVFDRAYDTDSRSCRALIVGTFECVNETWDGCDSYNDECYAMGQVLEDECTNYYDDYDY